MYLRCAIILSILKIILSCHIDNKPLEENAARSGGNNPGVNETFTRDRRTIDDSRTFDKINPPKEALRLLDIPIDELANREELTEKGRFLKRRQVVTCDGFILTIFRLTGNVQPTKTPVLMMHGLYQSSDVFAKQSKNQSLAFKLQDLGYDVWLGNLRGNKYSRQHVYLDPKEQKGEFFNYTYEEMGIYDLAATVDFILNETSHTQLHYISFSVGGTVFLVLNSMEPWQNAKFEGAHLLAPIGYQTDFPLINKLKPEATKGDETYDLLVQHGIVEIFPYTDDNTVFTPDECLGDITKSSKLICQRLNMKEKMDLKNENNAIEPTRGGSIKQLAHLAQNVNLKLFSRWDYGKHENEFRYGTKIPPEYILSRITVPTEIIFAPDDDLVSPKDIIDMAKDLANGTARAAGRSNFTHEDFVTAPDVFESVYNNIVKDLEKDSNQRTIGETSCTYTFCKHYFWPIFIILIIIILILLGFLMRYCFKEEEKESGVYRRPPSSHKSTQTVASVPATRLPVAPLPVALPAEPSPTTHLPVAHLPAEHTPAVYLPVAPLPVAHLPAEPPPSMHLPVAHLLAEPSLSRHLPVAHLPAEPSPSRHLPVAHLPAEPSPSRHLPVAHLPAEPSPATHFPVKPLPAPSLKAPHLQVKLPVKRVPNCSFEH